MSKIGAYKRLIHNIANLIFFLYDVCVIFIDSTQCLSISYAENTNVIKMDKNLYWISF